MRARILRVTLAAIVLTAMILLPVRNVSAARAFVTKKEALELCKSFHANFNKKKHWVKYKKGYKCTEIEWKDYTAGQDDFKVRCDGSGGKKSTKENGMFNCMWPDGFKKESSGSVDTGKPKADVEKTYGEVKVDESCVGSALIYTKKVGDKKYFCDESGSGTYEIILIVFNIFSAAIGALGVLGLIISGIAYLTSRDDAQRMAKAKKRIVQIVIGLGIYAALYLLLQWIIPGGIFGG